MENPSIQQPGPHQPPLRSNQENTTVFGRVTTPAFSKRSPLAGTMDQVRPQPIPWLCDHATVDWSTCPPQTPSGGGRAPTPYRSKTPASGTTQEGLTNRGPLQKDGLSGSETHHLPATRCMNAAAGRVIRSWTSMGVAAMGFAGAQPILRARVKPED